MPPEYGWRNTYDLVKTLCGTETGWASTNDQDIDIAVYQCQSTRPKPLLQSATHISSPLALLICLLCLVSYLSVWAAIFRLVR